MQKKNESLDKFIQMTIGCFMLAAGVYFFKIQNNFVTGGVTGIGVILAAITPISAGLWIWLLNIALLIVGFIILGKDTVYKTVYCSMLYSAFTYLFERYFALTSPLTDQIFLELIYAMLLTSIGSALIFNSDASSGGTDIVALILKKYTSIDVGKALLITDFAVAISSFWFFGVQTGLYSLLGLFSKAFIVDGVIESFNTCKYFVVITSKKEEITEYIMKTLHHGVTSNKVIGEYTHEEKTMLHTVCKRFEAIILRRRIKEIDPKAFIIITTSNEIIGRGFRSV
ncbi:MAG: YitT family protein [Clostridia bacterium]|nr:YitT family protein [Clostridia bacterium]